MDELNKTYIYIIFDIKWQYTRYKSEHGADSALVTTQPSKAAEIKQQTQEYEFGLWPIPCLNTNDI